VLNEVGTDFLGTGQFSDLQGVIIVAQAGQELHIKPGPGQIHSSVETVSSHTLSIKRFPALLGQFDHHFTGTTNTHEYSCFLDSGALNP
jgi:hypothetical protein